MDAKTVPGQMNQPPKDQLLGPSYETIDWVNTSSPTIDYYLRSHGPNPLDDTCPMQNIVENNDSGSGSLRSQNDINGGADIFGGNIKEAP